MSEGYNLVPYNQMKEICLKAGYTQNTRLFDACMSGKLSLNDDNLSVEKKIELEKKCLMEYTGRSLINCLNGELSESFYRTYLIPKQALSNKVLTLLFLAGLIIIALYYYLKNKM